jgi:L-histidine N-alpha-methyltransferase
MAQGLIRDVRDGLRGRPKRLPPKYFYDAVGSALFERITQLPEYYLTVPSEHCWPPTAGRSWQT